MKSLHVDALASRSPTYVLLQTLLLTLQLIYRNRMPETALLLMMGATLLTYGRTSEIETTLHLLSYRSAASAE